MTNRQRRKSRMSEKHGEFVLIRADAHLSDAEIHEPILNNPAAGKAAKEIGKKAARRAGLSEEEIRKLYD
jgi:hypothetical protein